MKPGVVGNPGSEFLPAALEVQETPPSPVGRWLLYLLLALFVAGLLWATLGRVDIVVTAPGRIVPDGRVKVVQAPESGTIAAIMVRDGQQVAAGQTLLRLDPTYAEADDLVLRERLNGLALEAAWRQALEQWLADGMGGNGPPGLPLRFAAADQSRAEGLYLEHRREISARLDRVAWEMAANRSERASVRAEQDRTRATLAILRERVAAYKALLDRNYGAKVQYLELLQQQTGLERTLPVLASRERQLQESAEAIAAGRGALLGETRTRNLLELARLDSEQGALAREAGKTRRHRQQRVITAPVSGTVHALSVHTVGGVVSPAQELMKIVPGNAPIEVEALLQNRDIGFVREGQRAQVKIDTFNFTRYGLIGARVTDISDDAVEDEHLGWVFRMRLKLDREEIAVEDRLVGLSPGMAITAEVKTGRRRLIEFFLSPLLRYRQESMRER